ncbi:MFS transporter [Sphingobium sp. CFD-2]|uniref:spinster family MFS transporter n=1 Tax=Sphingobium sp. CFD-2 TaxID=2878542 RepID=UPI00214B822C|nr:MFS transporter [Sphingobium sp. CFD-2]
MVVLDKHGQDADIVRGRPEYAWFVVAMLTLAYMCSYIDRQIINLMVEPIKQDLHLNDTRMSLLQGAAFAVAYLIFTPILGRRVDTGNRKNIIAIAVLAWCGSTLLGGFANNVTWLFISRAGVGAAEAALAPAAFSIIADYFPSERLPRAIGVFTMGPYLGGGFALIVGGALIGSSGDLVRSFDFLGNLAPWQLTFILVGLMGLPLGAAVFMLKEPVRRATSGAVEGDRHFSTLETLSYLWQRRAFYLRFFGMMAFTVVVFYSMPAWIPTILIRRYGSATGEVGLIYGTIVLVVGTLGVLAGPQLERCLHKRGYTSAGILCIAFASAGLVPTSLALFFFKSSAAVMVIGAIATFLYSMPQPIAASALQIVTPNRMRGVTSAIYVIIVSAIGLGIAPTLVALVTDFVFVDEKAVAASLALVCSTSAVIATWLAQSTRKPFVDALVAEESVALPTLEAKTSASEPGG